MKNCCTDSGPAPKQVSTEELGRTLQAKAEGADVVHAERLGGLQTLRQAKGAMLAREQTRLSATLGPKHPRVVALSQQIAVNENLAVQTQRAQARAQASVFQVDPNTWIVHGHVRTKDFKPVQQVTVALYTCEGQWLRQFGYSCTDADGYFKLSSKAASASGGVDTVGQGVATGPEAAGATAAQPGADVKAAPSAEVKTEPPSAAPAQESTTGSRQVCLNVTDGKQQFLGGAPGPLTPRLGAVDYREIILDSAAVCAPPPGTFFGSAPGSTDPGTQGGAGTIEKTRFLGNSNKREVHDLQNIKKSCGIDRMSADHQVYFKTADDAVKAGYDYCAYCFGKAKSKR